MSHASPDAKRGKPAGVAVPASPSWCLEIICHLLKPVVIDIHRGAMAAQVWHAHLWGCKWKQLRRKELFTLYLLTIRRILRNSCEHLTSFRIQFSRFLLTRLNCDVLLHVLLRATPSVILSRSLSTKLSVRGEKKMNWNVSFRYFFSQILLKFRISKLVHCVL